MLWVVFVACHSPLLGQSGGAPSLRGMYFDNHRARSMDAERASEQSQSRPTYRYDRGYYRNLQPASESSGGLGVVGSRQGHDTSAASLGEPFPSGAHYTHAQRTGRQLGRYSQPVPRSDVAYGGAGPYVGDPFNNGRYNFKLGGVPFLVSAGAFMEYNDNLNLSKTNKESGLIGGIYGELRGTFRYTRQHSLSFSLGVGYNYFFDDPVYSGGQGYYTYQSGGIPGVGSSGNNFSPYSIPLGSGLSFNMDFGEIGVTVYDYFSTDTIYLDDFSFDEDGVFSQFSNNAGASASWQINRKLTISSQLNRRDEFALDDGFDYLDNGQNSWSAVLSYSPNQTWTAGVAMTTSWVDYQKDAKSDLRSSDVGFFVNGPIPLSRNSTISLGAGSQVIDMEDASDLDDYYYQLTLSNQLNARFSHSLSFGHESALGIESDYVTTDYVRYGFGMIGYRGMRLSGSVFYEWEEASGGLDVGDYERYGLDVSIGRELKFSGLYLGLGYHYGRTEEDLYGGAYNEHSFSVDTSYPLTPKMVMGMGYQFWMVDGEGDGEEEFSGFEQNRLIMSLTYQF